jgi:threonine/homoserine/homoserine lactone efflux protein
MLVVFASAFALGLAFCAPPGVVTAEALRRGVTGGFRPALFVQLGSLVGDATWAVIALTGAAFLVRFPPVAVALRLAGVALLVHLAWSALRAARRPLGTARAAPGGHFAAGAALSLSNPNNVVFWTGVGGALLARTSGAFIVALAGFLLACTLWCFAFASLVGWGRHLVTDRFFVVVKVVCAVALVGFALRLALR